MQSLTVEKLVLINPAEINCEKQVFSNFVSGDKGQVWKYA